MRFPSGSSPRIISIGEDLLGRFEVYVEYDFPEENKIPCTVLLSLSLKKVSEWSRALGL